MKTDKHDLEALADMSSVMTAHALSCWEAGAGDCHVGSELARMLRSRVELAKTDTLDTTFLLVTLADVVQVITGKPVHGVNCHDCVYVAVMA